MSVLLAEVQPIQEPPVVSELSDTSATITWTAAFGEVDMYIIQIVDVSMNTIINQSVNSSVTSFTLTGLNPISDYRVVILTVDSDGNTAASDVTTFTTYGMIS